MHSCVDSAWRHVSAMFNSSTAERCIGEINTRPPVIFWCPRGICPRHAMTNKAKLWFHASLLLPPPLRYESDESNPTPSLRSMSVLFPSYNSIFQVLSFLQIFSAKSCRIVCLIRAPFFLDFITHNIWLGVLQAVKLLITRIFPSLLLLPPS